MYSTKLLFLFRQFILVSFLAMCLWLFLPQNLKAEEPIYPVTIDLVKVTLNQSQTMADFEAVGTSGCEKIATGGDNSNQCPSNVDWDFLTPIFGWVEKVGPGQQRQVVIPPDDPRMGQEISAEVVPNNWEYLRPGVDISSWANGNYQFCVKVFGDINNPFAINKKVAYEQTRCSDFTISTHGSPGYFLVLEPYQEILENGSTSYWVSLNCVGGFSGPVSNLRFAPGGNPFNSKVNFQFPSNISCGSATGIITVTSSPGAAPLSEPMAPFTTSVFTLTGDSSIGSKTGQSALRIYALPKILQFTANPNSVMVGQTSSLSWSSVHTLGCEAGGDWSGGKPSNSTGESTGILLKTSPAYSYSLKCYGALGSWVVSQVSVSVLPLPGKIRVNYTRDGVLNNTANLTVTYSISGPSAVVSSAYTIARDHDNLVPGIYTLTLTQAPAGLTLASISPVSLTLNPGGSEVFTLNFVTNACPANPESFKLATSPVRAGDTIPIIIPTGYVNGSVESSNSNAGVVVQTAGNFSLQAKQGGSVILMGKNWQYNGLNCQPQLLTVKIEDFQVEVNPLLTVAKQGEPVSSIIIRVTGNNWLTSQVTMNVPTITFFAPGSPIHGQALQLNGAVKFCKAGNLTNCGGSLVFTPADDSAILQFTPKNDAVLGNYKIMAEGKFSNGYTNSGSGFLRLEPGTTPPGGGGGGGGGSNNGGDPPVAPAQVSVSNSGNCDLMTITFTNWLDTNKIPPAPTGYRLYRSLTGPQDTPPQSYNWQQVMLVTGGNPKITKGDGSISYDWRFVEDHGIFAPGQKYYYAVTSVANGLESVKTLASPAPIIYPLNCGGAGSPRLDLSDKQIVSVNGQVNQNGQLACTGKTQTLDSKINRLNLGDVLKFKINICNSGDTDINPTPQNPLTVSDVFTNFKPPASGINLKFNGHSCNIASGCAYTLQNSSLSFTFTKGKLKNTNGIWSIELDLLAGAPPSYNSDIVLANNRGVISYGILRQPFNTGNLLVFIDNGNVPRQYEISP